LLCSSFFSCIYLTVLFSNSFMCSFASDITEGNGSMADQDKMSAKDSLWDCSCLVELERQSYKPGACGLNRGDDLCERTGGIYLTVLFSNSFMCSFASDITEGNGSMADPVGLQLFGGT
jgi:hypothetical protein